MEEKGVSSSGGVTVVGSDAPTEYRISPRSEFTGAPAVGSAGAPNPDSTALMVLKKKRGRPRKYGPDGPPPRVKTLSPKPISVSAPAAVIDFSTEKRPKIKTMSSAALLKQRQPPKLEADTIGEGEWLPCSVGSNFTPHIITAHAGEDVTMKVMSFSQQGPRAICILSANGIISSVTLRQPNSSGGTMTYEGRFEILSLMGSFMPSESGGIKNRSGGMSVSLAHSDGRVIGGGVAGLLIAASPVQIVVGSFIAGSNQDEQNPKKQKSESIVRNSPTSTVNFMSVGAKENYGGSHNRGSGTGYSLFHEDTRNGSNDHNDSSYHELNP